MFWKCAKQFEFRSLSLVTKLMLFYSVSTIALLAAISIFLYPTLINMLGHINPHDAAYVTAECYEKIIIVLLFSSLFAILTGHLIARKGLGRIRELENTMQQISVDSLQERINSDEWPKELKNLAKNFNDMLDRIQQSFLHLSAFSSDIAHELRTPINNLCVMTELVLTKNDYPEVCEKLFEKYMEEFQYLSKLIENLLFLARSDHGQIHLRKELINVHQEILNIVDYYQAYAFEKNIHITCEGQADLLVDRILFKRLISNLLSNAIKYTDEKGKINICIAVKNKTYVEIAIQDNGIGIAKEHIQHVFERFYRVDQSRAQHSGGLGLGLAIAKSIVNLHAGKIVIESEGTQGTRVLLYLPVVNPA